MRLANPVFLSPLAAQIALFAFVIARRPGLVRAEPLPPVRQDTMPTEPRSEYWFLGQSPKNLLAAGGKEFL